MHAAFITGVNSSIPFATNAYGQTVGGSENSVIDPLTGFPEFRAVLWQQGNVIDLGHSGATTPWRQASTMADKWSEGR